MDEDTKATVWFAACVLVAILFIAAAKAPSA